MPSDGSFIDAIIASPDDADLRLVYADWLEENDDPRAEYLRCQATLWDGSQDDTRRTALESRLSELRQSLPYSWLMILDPPTAINAVREAVLLDLIDLIGDGHLMHEYVLDVDLDSVCAARLLTRLSRQKVKITPRSSFPPGRIARWSEDGYRRILLGVSGLTWVAPWGYYADGSWIAEALAGHGMSYTVELINRQWSVVGRNETWIS